MWALLTPAQAIQLIVPGITALFALGFLCMRFYEWRLRYLSTLSLSFGAFAAASAVPIVRWPAAWQANALVAATLCAAGMLALAHAVLQRQHPHAGHEPTSCVAAGLLAGIACLASAHVHVIVQIDFVELGAAATLLYVAARAWAHERNRAVDRALLIALPAFGLSFFARTLLTTSVALAHGPQQLDATPYWIALQVAFALFAAALGLLLLAAAMADVIGDIRRRHGVDPLTGTLNRPALEQRANDELANRRRHPVTLIVFDIDHFKSVNDRFGHLAGDRVLTEFGRLLKESVRATDLVGRYGGEEFVVVLHNTDAASGYRIAERIRANLERARFHDVSPQLAVTVSGGVAQFDEHDSFVNLFARADRLLYRAKHDGRNRVMTAGAGGSAR